MKRTRIATPLGSAAAAALLITLSATAQAHAVDKPTEPGELKLIDTPAGKALADKDGNPLYLRDEDKPDTPDCTGDCATTWPAAIGYPTKADGVDGSTGQTKDNAEGADKPQVIYDAHPLYYYKDDKPNEPKGQDVKGWSLVGADGNALKADAAPDESASPSASAKPSDGASKSPEPGNESGAPMPTAASPDKTGTGTDTGTGTGDASTKPNAQTSSGTGTGTGMGDSSAAAQPPGALKATPKGAARGGADHGEQAAHAAQEETVEQSAMEQHPEAGPLALGSAALATAAGAVGMILVRRRRERNAMATGTATPEDGRS
ncbi:hypothetical protein [Streptomyces sp. NBC_01304]|uniref:hypothetical protein n=1 Tax=Streptomyces sp. NBC_01304 TaxID=2903818 RepID=UPI002E0F9703|nr:hypothetical protein OG430_26675 [Streptomyces sp. NBC_01304]